MAKNNKIPQQQAKNSQNEAFKQSANQVKNDAKKIQIKGQNQNNYIKNNSSFQKSIKKIDEIINQNEDVNENNRFKDKSKNNFKVETKNSLADFEKILEQITKQSLLYQEKIEDHQEQITISQNQTKIFHHLAATFDAFTQSLRFLTVMATLLTLVIGFGIYFAWQDIRSTPSSISIIGRETRFSTGNLQRDSEMCKDMQQQVIVATKQRALELSNGVGAKKIVNTQILILSDCVQQYTQNMELSSNSNSQNPQNNQSGQQANLSEFITSVQVTLQYLSN